MAYVVFGELVNKIRSFDVFNCGRYIGSVRAATTVNAFKHARQKFPYLSAGEMELQDPLNDDLRATIYKRRRAA